MKKGLKKFLGVTMVSGISASAIGSNYCGANAVYAAKPPEMTDEEMTDEEVVCMGFVDKYWFILEEVWKTEPSQWSDDIFRRLAKANSDVVKAESDLVSRIYWRENFSRKESWRRAEATKRELIKEIDSNQEKLELIRNWVCKIVFGDNKMSSAFG